MKRTILLTAVIAATFIFGLNAVEGNNEQKPGFFNRAWKNTKQFGKNTGTAIKDTATGKMTKTVKAGGYFNTQGEEFAHNDQGNLVPTGFKANPEQLKLAPRETTSSVVDTCEDTLKTTTKTTTTNVDLAIKQSTKDTEAIGYFYASDKRQKAVAAVAVTAIVWIYRDAICSFIGDRVADVAYAGGKVAGWFKKDAPEQE